MRLSSIHKVAIVAMTLFIGGCGYFFSEEEARIPGERIAVLRLDRSLEPDRRVADLQVRLPRPTAKPSWPQAGGSSAHVQHHIALPATLRSSVAGSAAQRRWDASELAASLCCVRWLRRCSALLCAASAVVLSITSVEKSFFAH